MKNIRELLFLQNINGIGRAKIIKTYIPYLKNGCSIDELKDIVAHNEKDDSCFWSNIHTLIFINKNMDLSTRSSDCSGFFMVSSIL
ncbi:hypothetical protein [Butyrivibrio sp. XPD2002]|uniref:hypothetical protein n=1 Tax=Butyrivibrio sp. XPD2002 TaxID=1280665 RepID=UPI0004793BB0|nr:hypothetical protein [Butyrivibrio sp. XPD2002]